MKICETWQFLISRDHSIYSAYMAIGRRGEEKSRIDSVFQ